MDNTHFHRRNLPHFYRPNSTYFITFRLKGSIPLKVLNELRNRAEFNRDFNSKTEKYENDKKFFAEYDNILDKKFEINYLLNPEIAEIVKSTLHYTDKKDYKLICYTIMPNHVHVVFHLLEDSVYAQSGLTVLQKSETNSADKNVCDTKNVTQTFQSERVSKIMQSIKGYSAREANKILKRKGPFWQSESYDHIIRDEDELETIIKYVVYNPVKANLVEKWEDWDFNYLIDQW